MASSSSELTLDLKTSSTVAPRTVGLLLQEMGAIGGGSARQATVEDYVKRLEEERGKIDGFRRELPLCMLLISDAIEALKAEAAQCGPVLEEFMPVRSKFEEEGLKMENKDSRDKMSWMSSAQLWSDNNRSSCNNNSNTNIRKNQGVEIKDKADEQKRSLNGSLFPAGGRYGTGGGAFTPFKACSAFPAGVRRVERRIPMPDLSLRAPASRSMSDESGGSGSSSRSATRTNSDNNNNLSASSTVNLNSQPQSAVRKPRRCWSPDLHRRFVCALEQLGGPYVATPKQIREVMQIDGLTNDEVKSHLQKYRLHAKRLPASGSISNQPVVLLGGIWVPRDPYRASKPSTSQSGSPQSPLQLAAASRGFSNKAEDSGEDEDAKSESYSWKGHLSRSGEDETE